MNSVVEWGEGGRGGVDGRGMGVDGCGTGAYGCGRGGVDGCVR